MVLITAAGGFYLGSLRSGISPFNIGASASPCRNRHRHHRVRASSIRPSNVRPTPSCAGLPTGPWRQGRIGLAHGLVLGFAAIFLGSLYLAHETNVPHRNPDAAYRRQLRRHLHPAQTRHHHQHLHRCLSRSPTAPLIGWTAARGIIEWPGVALFAILFVWQFPHFMAIGWMYREDYARAGIKLTATQVPREGSAAQMAVAPGALLRRTHDPRRSLAGRSRHHRLSSTPSRRNRPLQPTTSWYTVRFARILRDPVSAHLTHLRTRPAPCLRHLPSGCYLIAMMLNAKGRLLF